MTEQADQDLLPLYVRLYFDEDVSADIVRNLRQRGFDVLSTHEARRRANDAAVVARLLALLNSVTAEEMLNQLRHI